MLTSQEVCAAAGVTYRQLDHWARLGWLQPEPRIETGSGNNREWSDTEVQVVKAIARLLEAGFTPRAAMETARAFVDGQRTWVFLPGPTKLLLTWPDPEWLEMRTEIPGQMDLISGLLPHYTLEGSSDS